MPMLPATLAPGAGRDVEAARAGRLAADFAAGREERFGLVRALVRALGRALARDFEALLVRFAAEARFFIFLGLLDLGFLLDRFAAIKGS